MELERLLNCLVPLKHLLYERFVTEFSVFFKNLILTALSITSLTLFLYMVILVILSVNLAIYIDDTTLCCLCYRASG